MAEEQKDNSRADTVELDVFVMNLKKKEVHHQNCISGACNFGALEEPHIARSLAEARKVYECDPCGHCFQSRR